MTPFPVVAIDCIARGDVRLRPGIDTIKLGRLKDPRWSGEMRRESQAKGT
jgi:hypothetical protein